jgi:hypothetical protein
MRLSSELKYAIRALYDEAIDFSFDYPLKIVPEAGPKESLHYYLYKYRKTPPYRSALRLDSNGIAMGWNRITGAVYSPGFIAMHGLANLGQHLRGGDEAHLNVFLNQVGWLEKNAVRREDGAIVWPHHYDLQVGPLLLKAPWVSANVQGLVMSALVRGWRVTRRPALFELLKESFRVFEIDCASGGIRSQADGHVLYAEAPGLPAPGIMDGFMRSLLGLYDIYVETGNLVVQELFKQGVKGLKHFLPRWDYRNKWSWYSNRAYLCPPSYHCLNRLLLSVLARITGESLLAEYAEAWDYDRFSIWDRAEIYLAFLITKNSCRVKYRTWQSRSNGNS